MSSHDPTDAGNYAMAERLDALYGGDWEVNEEDRVADPAVGEELVGLLMAEQEGDGSRLFAAEPNNLAEFLETAGLI